MESEVLGRARSSVVPIDLSGYGYGNGGAHQSHETGADAAKGRGWIEVISAEARKTFDCHSTDRSRLSAMESEDRRAILVEQTESSTAGPCC